MGVAGVSFEPHPPNFENLYNFQRCSNVSDFRKSVWSVPSIPAAVLD